MIMQGRKGGQLGEANWGSIGRRLGGTGDGGWEQIDEFRSSQPDNECPRQLI